MDRHPDVPPLTPFPLPLTDGGAEAGQRGGVPASYPNSMRTNSPYQSVESLLPRNPSPSLPPLPISKFNRLMISPEPLPPQMIRPNPQGDELSAYINLGDLNVNDPQEKESGTMIGSKRRAAAIEIEHHRNVSTDSSVDGDADKSSKVPPSPTQNALFVFGNRDYTAAEMEKISAEQKLQNLAASDPKRLKRVLANRESAARSKERKARYITGLENKVVKLQAEANTFSSQLTLLKSEHESVCNQNRELKIRLQGMEEQARLRDALNEQMTIELRRLNL